MGNKKPLAALWLLLVGILLLFTFVGGNPFGSSKSGPEQLPISSFIDRVEDGQIKDVAINGNWIVGSPAVGAPAKFATYADEAGKADLIKALREKDATYGYEPTGESGGFSSLLITMLPMVFLLFMLWLFMRGMAKAQQGGLRGMAANKAKMHHNVKERFTDVEGVPEAVASAQQLVRFLKDPKRYAKTGGRMPKGYLFTGPSGTGKTLLARAVAGEANVPFFSMAASEFVEMLVGMGASRVRELFTEARKHAPCIIFIDEFDAVAKKRGGFASGSGNDEREQTLNQILVEMDGFTTNDGVIVIAATNRPEVLDSAVLRPGRFDNKLVVPRPNVRGRRKILDVHAKGKPMDPDVDLDVLAKATPGMTGADLADLLNKGALQAAENERPTISMKDLIEARDTVMAGEERKSEVLTDYTKKLIAAHESGHTLAGWLTPHAEKVHRVTIIPRGLSLGSTWHLPEDDRPLRSKRQMLADIVSLYGGRVAEFLVFGPDEITSGASDDLKRATATAKSMVEDYAMSTVGDAPPRVYGAKESGMVFSESTVDFSQATHDGVDKAINAILAEQYAKTVKLLTDNRAKLDELTAALIEKETLEHEEILAILGPRPALT